MSYAGDITCQDCWDGLARETSAQLVDVRTTAEWNFVGIPDLGDVGREPILLEWQSFPDMAQDPRFAERLSKALQDRGCGPDTPLYFLCRSGARSRSAAMAMTAAGYRNCFNIQDGFEGGHDAHGHRGKVSGWKHAGLPWRQV